MNSSESDSDCSAQNDLIRRYSELLGVDDDYEEDHDSGEDDELAGMARAMSDRLCGDKATCGAPPCPLTFHRLPGGSGRYYALRDNFNCSSDIFAMARSPLHAYHIITWPAVLWLRGFRLGSALCTGGGVASPQPEQTYPEVNIIVRVAASEPNALIHRHTAL